MTTATKRCPVGYCEPGECDCPPSSVARSSSSSTSSRPATQRQLRTTDALVCGDPSCSEPIEQPLTGRPKLYCDATCRKNAARHRAFEDYSTALGQWRNRDAARSAARNAEIDDWDLRPVPEPEPWELQAEQAGWSKPYHWDHDKKVHAYGPRPSEYRTPDHDRMPSPPPAPRTGKKGQGYYW